MKAGCECTAGGARAWLNRGHGLNCGAATFCLMCHAGRLASIASTQQKIAAKKKPKSQDLGWHKCISTAAITEALELRWALANLHMRTQ